MNNLTKISTISELKEDFLNNFIINGISLIVIKEGDKYFVLNGTCPHMGGNLSHGKLKNKCVVECLWHHSEYDLETGKPIKGPQITSIQIVNSLIKLTLPPIHIYDIVIKDDFLYIKGNVVEQIVRMKN